MCGIAGHVGADRLPEHRVARCLAVMRHRGPDACGAHVHRTRDGRFVHLLHTRLAIVDPDPRSNQPYAGGSGRLAFNGEIYNHAEIAAERGWTGSARRTRGDTEVLARVLAEDGLAGLEALEGMWALAWIDERTDMFLLARDRFGQKPLWIWETDGGLYFASEIKALEALAGRRAPVDLDHVRRFLVNGYRALGKTDAEFLRGPRRLAAGTALEIDGTGRLQARRYWSPAVEGREDPSLSFEEAVAGVRTALGASVERHLRADVPLAFLLSGGVDSTALVSIARRDLGRDVHAFTVIGDDPRYDERAVVEATVAELGIRHTAVPLRTEDFLDDLCTMVREHDAPISTVSYFVQWRLMRAVQAAGYRVTVSGTGADELFSGYFDHHNAYLFEVKSDPARHAEALEEWRATVGACVRNPVLRDPDCFVRDPDERGHIFLDAPALSACLVEPWHEPFAETRYRDGLLRNRMLNELFHEAVPPILHEDDLNAMAHSIENRSPFLDRPLFDLAQTIPTRHLVRHGAAKAVLRAAVRGIAPDHVLDEPRKTGFNASMQDLLDGRDPAVRARVLADGPVWEVVSRPAVEALLDAPRLENSRSKFLFSVLGVQAFLEERDA